MLQSVYSFTNILRCTDVYLKAKMDAEEAAQSPLAMIQQISSFVACFSVIAGLTPQKTAVRPPLSSQIKQPSLRSHQRLPKSNASLQTPCQFFCLHKMSLLPKQRRELLCLKISVTHFYKTIMTNIHTRHHMAVMKICMGGGLNERHFRTGKQMRSHTPTWKHTHTKAWK